MARAANTQPASVARGLRGNCFPSRKSRASSFTFSKSFVISFFFFIVSFVLTCSKPIARRCLHVSVFQRLSPAPPCLPANRRSGSYRLLHFLLGHHAFRVVHTN